jgi:cell division protein ZapA (FtsZ GTPase activity inhibitor)
MNDPKNDVPAGPSAKRIVAVQIAGRDYKIRTDSDEDSLRKVAGYVDRAMQRIRAATGTVDTADVAMLTCLNLARQILALHDERTKAGRVSGKVVDELRLRELIERVENVKPAVFSGSLGHPSEEPTEPSSPGGANSSGHSSTESARAPARTLELPSPEALRERAAEEASRADAREAEAGVSSPPKMAAGGERAS